MDWIPAVMASVITGFVTFAVTNKQTDGSVEQEYTKNITNLFDVYQKQVEGLRGEVNELKAQIKEMEATYLKDISNYKVSIGKLEVENGFLRDENHVLREENTTLKGGITNGI